MERREFIKQSSVAAAGLALLPTKSLFASAKDKVKLGYIGVGLRGRDHVNEGLLRDDVDIVAICDVQESSLKYCREQFTKAGKPLPQEYTGGLDAYKRLLDRKDIDAVIIATPWQFHHPQAIDAMKAGKYVGCEVVAGLSVQDHWDLVNTSENTGIPYMTMENVCYRRDVMAVLNMVRQGLFGELIHLQGGYQHDLREIKFNDGGNGKEHGVEFGEKGYSEAHWRTEHSVHRNGDLYPTHGVGPIAQFLNINHGNRFLSLCS